MVTQNHIPDLAYLVWFGLAAIALQIYQFLNAGLCKDVMATLDPFGKFQLYKYLPQLIEADIGITSAKENLFDQLVQLPHVNPSSTPHPSDTR